MQSLADALREWQNFYVVVGSAAGALTGLQFVVMTLLAQIGAAGSMREIRAFGTPTLVHFCSALLLSAAMNAPWHEAGTLALCLGACGLAGVCYSLTIFWHAHKAAYNPDLEDWIWYTGLPLAAHMAVFSGTFLLWWNLHLCFSILAIDSLLFLLMGIHNSWDTVTYITVKHNRRRNQVDTTGDAMIELPAEAKNVKTD